ncbi:hypothetical protein OHB12_19525 [Nocardia sp. NBC_01730]|uniref:hypothetical protein n=1 Tax=Nocardia sp. NBC_01730 TaxID=2975998 RepID=UPI002E10CA16|nr:hypothetical protein OHB12_19525 [Nocardia sp. NBC_01730]
MNFPRSAGVPSFADEWRTMHADCAAETPPTSLEEARFVLDLHASDGPRCLQYLVAAAYSFGYDDE